MRIKFIVLSILGIIFSLSSCKEKTNGIANVQNKKETTKEIKLFYGEQAGFVDSLINFAGVKPDVSYPFVGIILPVSYCEPCKVDVTNYLNDLFSKIHGLPKDNILIITEEMRKKEIPLYKKEDYPLNNWDTLNLLLSDNWGVRILKKLDLIGASMFIVDTTGNVIFKKQFKNTVEYFDDVDSVANLINVK